MTTLEVLQAARARISDPAKWCQHAGEEGDRRCMVTAVRAVSQFGSPEASGAFTLLRAAGGVDFNNRLAAFNDTHTHAEVLALFDKAIAAEAAK